MKDYFSKKVLALVIIIPLSLFLRGCKVESTQTETVKEKITKTDVTEVMEREAERINKTSFGASLKMPEIPEVELSIRHSTPTR